MGEYTNTRYLNIMGGIALVIMAVAAVALGVLYY
jgi:hypothetical protein